MIGKHDVHRKLRTIVLPCVDLGQKMERCMSKVEHDLRGCVHLIIGYADLLAAETNGSLVPQQLECLTNIKAGAKGVQDAIARGQARLDELVHPKSRRK